MGSVARSHPLVTVLFADIKVRESSGDDLYHSVRFTCSVRHKIACGQLLNPTATQTSECLRCLVPSHPFGNLCSCQ
jgi:hypothetical protein